jgi:hypothetical protein
MSKRLSVVVTVPGLRLKSELNGTREHWAKIERRKREQKDNTAIALCQLGAEVTNRLRGAKRLRVSFTRIGGKTMDTDNLTASFKFIRDAVAHWLRKDDSPKSGIEWAMPPGQETGSYGIRIQIEEV